MAGEARPRRSPPTRARGRRCWRWPEPATTGTAPDARVPRVAQRSRRRSARAQTSMRDRPADGRRRQRRARQAPAATASAEGPAVDRTATASTRSASSSGASASQRAGRDRTGRGRRPKEGPRHRQRQHARSSADERLDSRPVRCRADIFAPFAPRAREAAVGRRPPRPERRHARGGGDRERAQVRARIAERKADRHPTEHEPQRRHARLQAAARACPRATSAAAARSPARRRRTRSPPARRARTRRRSGRATPSDGGAARATGTAVAESSPGRSGPPGARRRQAL